ncbi:hypothetical protein [Cetobacterium sp.]
MENKKDINLLFLKNKVGQENIKLILEYIKIKVDEEKIKNQKLKV